MISRERTTYSITAVRVQKGYQKYVVLVRVTPSDLTGPEATFTERAECSTVEEAKAKQLQMVREISERLTAQGHSVVNVNVTP